MLGTFLAPLALTMRGATLAPRAPQRTKIAAGIFDALKPKPRAPPPTTDTAPSWSDLAERLHAVSTPAEREFRSTLASGRGDAHSLATLRLFDAPPDTKPRVTLYRDFAAWCPYSEKVWMLLEEKRVPYTVKKIPMNCYGEKPAWFWQMQPSGGIPVAEIDDYVITESNDILSEIEARFTDGYRPMLPDPESASAPRVRPLLALERTLFSCWFRWLTSSQSDGAQRTNFESIMSDVNSELEKDPAGPYFLGADVTLVDCMFAPFLERMAASVLYYKGLRVRRNAKWPAVEAWFIAMEGRPSFRNIQSDFYTHAHALPPQVGRCHFAGDGRAHADVIDGADGSWSLPLKADDGDLAEPLTGFGQADDAARREAAERLISNHQAIVRFAARGTSGPGFPGVSAELSDPNASPDENAVAHVDGALRHVAHALISGTEEAAPALDGTTLSPEVLTPTLGYLRDRVSVPRDMGYPAARQFRAHLNWMAETVGAKAAR